jgi:hypothetical protein
MSPPPPGVSEEDKLVFGGSLSALASRAALELDSLLRFQRSNLGAVAWCI